ncbi:MULTISPECIES: hypothetical protein [Acinetobacter]|uniref:hypothetical protein n=1 Tax=Acinetobacter TaxID=469 RepID=UPI000E5BBA7A|nr:MULTISPECIES: hypothetical protein [Acinetobacter]MBO3639240.1 hypothetical protein [Acinetobacter soli]MBO3671283.1 hypothetical protein [Acinetobacter soli]MBV6550403.1 hypothetical protein [Acinetobacter soli]MCE6006244.1 hypothetical protein [Acinetobacter soli]MCF3127157.1 hypothetical protein [Acinetobacter soli]
MSDTSKMIVERIGETDQRYLDGNSPELALERGDLRLQLVTLSHNRQERLHFLHEAIAILEQSRVEFEEMPMSMYIDLSLQLAKAYMVYFELSQDNKFALITQQILKPLAHLNHGDVYFFLAYASIVKKELAFTRHWLDKYIKSEQLDLELLQQHSAFNSVRSLDWFKALIHSKTH